jgi:hypothetical protein
MTSVLAATFSGSCALLTNLNVSNSTTGTLSISRGGIGTTTLTANHILVGNAATSILQSPNLSWNNTSNTLSASSFVSSGAATEQRHLRAQASEQRHEKTELLKKNINLFL